MARHCPLQLILPLPLPRLLQPALTGMAPRTWSWTSCPAVQSSYHQPHRQPQVDPPKYLGMIQRRVYDLSVEAAAGAIAEENGARGQQAGRQGGAGNGARALEDDVERRVQLQGR